MAPTADFRKDLAALMDLIDKAKRELKEAEVSFRGEIARLRWECENFSSLATESENKCEDLKAKLKNAGAIAAKREEQLTAAVVDLLEALSDYSSLSDRACISVAVKHRLKNSGIELPGVFPVPAEDYRPTRFCRCPDCIAASKVPNWSDL